MSDPDFHPDKDADEEKDDHDLAEGVDDDDEPPIDSDTKSTPDTVGMTQQERARNEHRTRFYNRIEKPAPKSSTVYLRDYADLHRILSGWHDPEFRKQPENHKGYYRIQKWKAATSRTPDGLTKKVIVSRTNEEQAVESKPPPKDSGKGNNQPKKKGKTKEVGPKLMVPFEEIFDHIDQAHYGGSHFKVKATHNEVNKSCANITRAHVTAYIDVCPVCASQHPNIQKAKKGAMKPIMSEQFRDRFQADLVDMRHKKKKNIYGVTMRWLLVIKDHFTKFVYLVPIPRKQAKYVIHELYNYFGLIGYPRIMQTDNGTEFVVKQVVEGLKKRMPTMVTVTSRPRNPNENGSVDYANGHIKNRISDCEQEDTLRGVPPNWTRYLGRVMASMNSVNTGKGPSPCETVFGIQYDDNLPCNISDLRKCETLEERMDLVEHKRFDDMARSRCYLQDGEDTDGHDDDKTDMTAKRKLHYSNQFWEDSDVEDEKETSDEEDCYDEEHESQKEQAKKKQKKRKEAP